jgi:selenocysteine-specific elongation factor
MTSTIDIRLAPTAEDAGPPADRRLPPRLTLHIGAARAVAQTRLLGGSIARLTLDRPLPLHVGDRVLLRDPGAVADRATGRPVLGATVLDVRPPRLRGTGAAAAAERELGSWPESPEATDLLRRHRLLRSGTASAMGLQDLPAPVRGDWLVDPAHWRQLRQRLVRAVAANARKDPLALGMPIDAARATLGLPDRGLVEALATWRAGASPDEGELVELRAGYLLPGRGPTAGQPDGSPGRDPAAQDTPAQDIPAPAAGPAAAPAAAGLPAAVAAAVRTLLADLAEEPFSAPDSDRLRQLGLDTRAVAAAERAGLVRRLPGNVVLPADAAARAERILAGLPQPFTTSEARQALRSSRRVVIPLLEWLDRERITRRLPDDRRTIREQSGAGLTNGER